MTITNNKEACRTALVLAITAPNDKLAAECEAIAHGLEKTLTRGEIRSVRKFIEQIIESEFTNRSIMNAISKELEPINRRLEALENKSGTFDLGGGYRCTTHE